MTMRIFYALARLYGLVAIVMLLHVDGGAFQSDNNRALIAPRESADVAHPHKLERCFFYELWRFFLLYMRLRCALSPLSCAIFWLI